MATLAELESAYAALATIFRTDLAPRVNAIRRGVQAGDTFAEVGSEINALRAEFDNAYQRVFEILQQAEQLPSQDGRADLIARLERSLNTNQSNNRATLSRIEIDARDNQATQDKAAADQGTGAQSAGAETLEEQRGKAEAASTQNPGTAPEQQSESGAISASPTTVVPSNAASSQPAAVPEVPGAPPTVVAAAPTAQDQLPGTPAQGQGVLQPPSPSDAQQFYIYKAIMVTNNFSGGQFTQDLEGVLLQIPVARTQRQNGVLVPQAQERSAVSDTTPAEARTNVAPVPTVIPKDQIQAQAPAGDATVYGTAETAPPDSDGESVAVAQPSGSTGQGSATTTVGGFTIKASSGTASNGVFTTVFIVSRDGVQGFAGDIDGIVAAAQSVQQRSFGGVVEDVAQWVGGGGAARLQQQAEAQAQARVTSGDAAPNTSINLARET